MERKEGIGRYIKKPLLYIVLLGMSVIFILPLFQAVTSSLKTFEETLQYPVTWFPKVPQWKNYIDGFSYFQSVYPVARWFLNSGFTTAMIVLGNVLSGCFIAYGFARFKGRGKNLWFLLILSTMLIPVYCTLIPLLIIFRILHMYNTYFALIVQPFFGTAVYVFLFRQFIMGVPKEIDEAAIMDGSSPFGIFFRIILPLTRPAMIAVGVLCFVAAWGDFFTPMIFLSTDKLYTISVGLAIISTQIATQATNRQYISVITVLVAIPNIIVFFAAQKYFVGGLTIGSLKA